MMQREWVLFYWHIQKLEGFESEKFKSLCVTVIVLIIRFIVLQGLNCSVCLSEIILAGSIQIKSKLRSHFFVFLRQKIDKWDLFYQFYYSRPRFWKKTGSGRKNLFMRSLHVPNGSFSSSNWNTFLNLEIMTELLVWFRVNKFPFFHTF